jgi:hypothetical protein
LRDLVSRELYTYYWYHVDGDSSIVPWHGSA